MHGSALVAETHRIRDAQPDDAPEIARLWLDMMKEHSRFDPRIRLRPAARDVYEAYARSHIRNPEGLCLVAETPGLPGPRGLAGFVLAFVCQNAPLFDPPKFGFLSDITVAEEHRRCGMGRELVRRVREWMASRGVESIQLQVYSHNAVGRAFWSSLGFLSSYDRMMLEI